LFPGNYDHHSVRQSVWRWRCPSLLDLPRSERGTQGRSDYEYFLYYAVFWCDCPHERWTLDRQTSASVIWCFCGYTSLCTAVHNDLSDRHTAIHDCCRNESIYQCTGLLDNRYDLNCRRSYCQSPIRSIIYFCFGLWCAGCRDCNCNFSISVGCICTVFPDKKIRIKGSILEKGRICRMHRLCKKYRKPWNSRFYHAVDKQSCIYLLQQYSVECRWRYLHISHDNRIERSPIG